MSKLIWVSGNELDLKPNMKKIGETKVDGFVYNVYTDIVDDEDLACQLDMKLQPALNEYIIETYNDSTACLSHFTK